MKNDEDDLKHSSDDEIENEDELNDEEDNQFDNDDYDDDDDLWIVKIPLIHIFVIDIDLYYYFLNFLKYSIIIYIWSQSNLGKILKTHNPS